MVISDNLTGSRLRHGSFQSTPIYDIASVYESILNFRNNCNRPFHIITKTAYKIRYKNSNNKQQQQQQQRENRSLGLCRVLDDQLKH